MKQKISGGKGDKLNPKDVDKTQLALGIKAEMEHTNSRRVAMEIAIDHLAEDPNYYTKLNKAKLENCSPCNINKFIEHVVNNWGILKEYGANEMNRLINKFKDEAGDLNINHLSDAQLKAMINRFDQLKNGLPSDSRDLNRYSLKQLIKLVSKAGYETPDDEEEEEQPEDVAYNENGITVWSGHRRDNCIEYGRGRSWCIAQRNNTNWAGYRFGRNWKYPSFYIVKNTNLPSSDDLHHIVVQVLNTGNYKFTDASNSPGMSGELTWEELVGEVPYLRNLRSVFKYIPLSKAELSAHVYKENPISIHQFNKFDFPQQQKYIIARRDNSYKRNLFDDISDDKFFEKYLPQSGKLASWLSRSPYILGKELFIDYILPYALEYSKENQKSIFANFRVNSTFETEKEMETFLSKSDAPFEVKKYIIESKKYPNYTVVFYYVHGGNKIVRLDNLKKFKISILDEDNEYFPNVKINKRTEKYILDYPEITSIDVATLSNLKSEYNLSDNFDRIIINKISSTESEYRYFKEINGEKYFFDVANFVVAKTSNGFSPLKGEELRKEEFKAEFENKYVNDDSYLNNIINLLISSKLSYSQLWLIIDKLKYNGYSTNGFDKILLTNNNNSLIAITAREFSNFNKKYNVLYSANFEEGKGDEEINRENEQLYGIYYREKEKDISTPEMLSWISARRPSYNEARVLLYIPIRQNVRVVSEVVNGDNHIVLVNMDDPSNSKIISNRSGKALNFIARRVHGGAPAAPVAGGAPAPVPNEMPIRRGRGRPPRNFNPGNPGIGVPPPVANPAPAPAPGAIAPVAAPGLLPQNGTGINILAAAGMNVNPHALNFRLRRTLEGNWNMVNVVGNRGAARRSNLLVGRGRVTQAYQKGTDVMYIITMNNNIRVASIVMQPGNQHYVAIRGSIIHLNDPSSLPQILTNNGINEGLKIFITNELLESSPHKKEYIKNILKEYLNYK